MKNISALYQGRNPVRASADADYFYTFALVSMLAFLVFGAVGEACGQSRKPSAPEMNWVVTASARVLTLEEICAWPPAQIVQWGYFDKCMQYAQLDELKRLRADVKRLESLLKGAK